MAKIENCLSYINAYCSLSQRCLPVAKSLSGLASFAQSVWLKSVWMSQLLSQLFQNMLLDPMGFCSFPIYTGFKANICSFNIDIKKR